ncbi:hypothetical protein BD310DRAFT_356652 [Dichomitus squalens]|uniref:F-box domain-containing protein n=1 Tax=Dichomitus squalens TaxID=114155 RepID=A0A4Q9PYZ7_9APHY|nr:hypothetical protein BD310DRAFT_356652 [Dichomitus squalens]
MGWKRFQEYASLVRQIVVDPLVHGNLSISPPGLLNDSIWHQLTSLVLGCTPILPRLEAVVIKGAVDDDRLFDMGALSLTNPGIHKLIIDFTYPQPLPTVRRQRIQEVLQSAFAVCFSSTPNVEKLTIRSVLPLLDWKSLPISHVRLCQLKVNTLTSDPTDLLHLISLANLEELSCRVTFQTAVYLEPFRFRKLHTLFVSGSWHSTRDNFLAHVDAPQLRALSIQTVKFPRGAEQMPQWSSQYLRTVPAAFPSITDFSWLCSQMKWVGGAVDTRATLAELLEPLAPLRMLRRFSVRFSGPTVVPHSSSDFEWIADTWPDLEAFTFVLDAIFATRDINIETVASFARRCARLRSLRIPQTISKSTSDTIVDIHPQIPPTLRDLVIDNLFWQMEHEGVDMDEKEPLATLPLSFPSANVTLGRITHLPQLSTT